jgi:hypothetical protein
MDMPDNSKKISSREIGVFGSRTESEFEKAVLLARAKRRGRVETFLESAPDEAKSEFLDALSALNKMLIDHATVSERLLVFIDNNVLQDILQRERSDQPLRRTRFHALLAFLMLAEDYYLLDVFACVSPAVFYEAAHRGTRPHLDAFSETVDALAEIGLATHTVGISDPDDLPGLFELIRVDEGEIRLALDEIKNKSWKRNFSSGMFGTRIPFGVAEDECPEVRLGYFDTWYVKFLLMHIIEKRMYNENSGQPKARKLMRNPQEKVFSFLKPKNEGVEGLGDIELMTYCDLSAQTIRRSPHITMGVTFDEGLRDALGRRATVQSRTSVVVGRDGVSDGTMRISYSLKDSARRNAKADRRLEEYRLAYSEFEKVIRPYFPAEDEPQ